jgi:hypothetical protein
MSAQKKTDSKVTIKIPRALYNRLSEIVSGTGFNSVTDFIIYVMRDLVATSHAPKSTDVNEDSRLSPEEIAAIRKRLQTLGYL